VIYEFKLPDLGEGLTEGEIARWLVAEGDEVAEDDPLVEIATDKTTVEIPSPYAGTVTAIHVGEGEAVPVGTVLVTIGHAEAVDAGTPSGSAPTRPAVVTSGTAGTVQRPADEGTPRVRATPLVRRIAADLGVDLVAVAGSGRNGQITEADIRAHASSAPAPASASEGRRERVRGVRRAIVEHLTVCHREVPAVTFVEECDFTGLDLRRIVPLTLKAVAESLQEYRELNARLAADEIVYLDRYDLGIAVQTTQGLLVPVVRGCDHRTVDELDTEIRRLAEEARAGTLAPEELRGSTFTVTSAGKLGGVLVTPLVNYPEVGILGLHRISEQPVIRDGGIVVRQMGYVSLTFDHRVVDGARAAEFCLQVIGRLQR
jgi:pyruvate dehydrogenase E2 component (dihydrolipoamide acetyltransferase)